MSSSRFRVAFIPNQNAGVNYLRMATWAFEMNKYRNVEAAVYGFQYHMLEPHPWEYELRFDSTIRQKIEMLCKVADVVIWHPLHYQHSLEFFNEMKMRYGKPFFVETDDNYVDVPSWNEGFHSYSPNGFHRKMAVESLANSDGLIVSTKHLLDTYCSDPFPFNTNAQIVENSLDFKGDSKFVGWDKVSNKKHKGIRLGWIGGRTHFGDLMMIAPVLRILLEKYRNRISLVLVNSALRMSCESLGVKYPFEGLPNVREVEHSVDINRYAPFAASFGFDVGLAPLVDCNFNRSKSNLRWLEYSALKIPTVASDLNHFKESITHGKDGFLAHENSLDGWLDHLERLISDHSLRLEVGRAAYNKVKKDFNVKNNAPKYLRFLKQVVSDGLVEMAVA